MGAGLLARRSPMRASGSMAWSTPCSFFSVFDLQRWLPVCTCLCPWQRADSRSSKRPWLVERAGAPVACELQLLPSCMHPVLVPDPLSPAAHIWALPTRALMLVRLFGNGGSSMLLMSNVHTARTRRPLACCLRFYAVPLSSVHMCPLSGVLPGVYSYPWWCVRYARMSEQYQGCNHSDTGAKPGEPGEPCGAAAVSQ